MKKTFAPKTFAAKTFACGTFAGVGAAVVETPRQPTQVGGVASPGRAWRQDWEYPSPREPKKPEPKVYVTRGRASFSFKAKGSGSRTIPNFAGSGALAFVLAGSGSGNGKIPVFAASGEGCVRVRSGGKGSVSLGMGRVWEILSEQERRARIELEDRMFLGV